MTHTERIVRFLIADALEPFTQEERRSILAEYVREAILEEREACAEAAESAAAHPGMNCGCGECVGAASAAAAIRARQ